MYKLRIYFIVFGIMCYKSFMAQSAWVETVTELITPKTIGEAVKDVNAKLKSNPQDVDALMMKGNLIYYTYAYSLPDISLQSNINEDVYQPQIGSIGEVQIQLPEDTANRAVDYLLQALEHAPDRVDIHMGICYIYSVSMQADKLIHYLPILKGYDIDDDDLPYTMEDYAMNFIVRNSFEKGISIYEKISEMYPDEGGIVSDEAAQYYDQGNIKKAMELMELSLTKKNLDDITWNNAFYFYGIDEDYTKALFALEKYSELTSTANNLFYRGLIDFSNNKSAYKNTFDIYLKSNSEDQPNENVAEYLTSSEFLNSITDYSKMADMGLNDAYSIILHKYYALKFPNEFLPAFKYAESFTFNHNYKKAVENYKKVNLKNATDKDKEDYKFYYAWALYKNNEIDKAIELWSSLLASNNFYYKSAAAYFTGNMYLANKDIEKANKYFSMVADNASASKYAIYCKNLLSK